MSAGTQFDKQQQVANAEPRRRAFLSVMFSPDESEEDGRSKCAMRLAVIADVGVEATGAGQRSLQIVLMEVERFSSVFLISVISLAEGRDVGIEDLAR